MSALLLRKEALLSRKETGQLNRKLETWKKDDHMFVETRAAKCVLACVKAKSCVTVTGSSGMGKTFTVRHVALQMAGDGYDILPVTSPKDIETYYNPNKKVLFVIDNVCGTYTLNKNVLDKWKSLTDTITDILNDQVIKIIASCRLQIYQDDNFKTLPLFTICECNLLSQDICRLETERQSLAELYLKHDAFNVSEYLDLYDFFPLLCKLYKDNPNYDVTEFFKNPFLVYEAEISKLWEENAYSKYCALAICVMFNNHINEEWLTEDIDKDIKTIIKKTCKVCKLERGTSRLVIRDELESLTHTFIRKDTDIQSKCWSASTQTKMKGTKANKRQDSFYCTIHDKLFDCLVSYFGKVMIPTMIKYGDSRLIAERFMFEKQNDSEWGTAIIPDEYQQMYLRRLIDDWVEGHVSHVFNNINMKKQKFRDICLKFLTQLDPTFQKKLAEICNVTYYTTDESYGHTSPLIHCCTEGDISMVQWFCDHGSDVYQCNGYNESPLYIACFKGHTKVVTLLIDNNADVNQCTNLGKSPLYIACAGGYTDIVTILLDNHAHINQCTDRRKSPLYIACAGGYTELVTILIDNKADVNQCTDKEKSPLYIACSKGYTEIVYKLIGKKSDVNQCSKREESPLYKACDRGYIEVVTILLDNNANVNQLNQYGQSALYTTCARGYTEIVTKLINNNADVNPCKDEGRSPLYEACSGGYTEIVTKLIDNNADVNQCTEEGKSSLYKACGRGHIKVIRLLLDNNADVNQCTEWETESPLFKACAGGYTEVVTALLEAHADVNLSSDEGKSPLYIACELGYTEIVTKLINNKADVNQCTEWGESPLHKACAGGHTEVVTLLIDSKTNVNQCTDTGISPLHVASVRGYTEVESILIDNNADVNKCTNEGESSLFVACKAWRDLLNSSDRYIYLHIHYHGYRKLEVNSENKERYSETVKLLIHAEADYRLCNKEGVSPLDLFKQQYIIDLIKSWRGKEET